jgi:hypothetical protein
MLLICNDLLSLCRSNHSIRHNNSNSFVCNKNFLFGSKISVE